MELSLCLMEQLAQLFLMLLVGIILVRCRILKDSDSKVISLFVLYAVTPCAIINSFSIECTKETLAGLGMALAAGALVQCLYIVLTTLLAKVFHFNGIEKATLIYPNCGNLVIPLAGTVLGSEWVIYTSGYMATQTILMWTHCRSIVSGRKEYDLKNIFLNVGMISVLAGFLLFVFQIRLPDTLTAVSGKLGDMMGPLSMIVIGMLIGGMKLKTVFERPRAYFIAALRLLILPFVAVFLIKVSGAGRFLPDGDQILMITTMAACAPAAANITQFAQLYDTDSAYAGVLNVITVLFSIVTMPMVIMVYQLL